MNAHYDTLNSSFNGWLAFELSVLRRLQFRSVMVPLAGEPNLDVQLKGWGVRVLSNDPRQWAATAGLARVENNAEQLSEDDIEIVLTGVDEPESPHEAQVLHRWFDVADSVWLRSVRRNAERLDNKLRRALALRFAIMVGDYARSFDDQTRALRDSLPTVFRRFCELDPPPFTNAQQNRSFNQAAHHFIAEQHADLLFLRLPAVRSPDTALRNSAWAWREVYLRGTDDFWSKMEAEKRHRLGAPAATKEQYLSFVEDFLEAAAHIKAWAIAHHDDSIISINELTETIKRVRRVNEIYTKDFSELVGRRAAIITA